MIECLFHLTPVTRKRPIICFPYAGGSHIVYKRLTEALKECEADIWVYEPPGHVYTEGDPISDIDDLCQLYLSQFPVALWEKEIILIGHSFGSYVACHFASMAAKLAKKPLKLVLCASCAPSTPKIPLLSELSLEDLVAELVKHQCLEEKLLQTPELISYYYPALCADFKIYENFTFPRMVTHLKTLILCAYEDKMVPITEAFAWKKYFDDCTIDFLNGNHLFINQPTAIKQMINLIQFHHGALL